MSTKIYNGYILSKMDMQELLQFCKEMAHEMREAKKQSIISTIANLIVDKLDRIAVGEFDMDNYIKESKPPKSLYGDSLRYVKERIKKLTEYERDPVFDFKSNAMFFPMEDKILCLLFQDNRELLKIWNKKVKEYHYQDQCDKPSKISAKAWKQRKADWNHVLGGDGWGKPIDNGFEFTFTNKEVEYPYPSKEEIVKAMPKFEKRLHAITREKYMADELGKAKAEATDGDEKEFNLWKHYGQIKKYMDTPEGQTALKVLENEVAGQMIVKITPGIITNDYFV